MFRILFLLGLVYTGSVLAADSDDHVEKYRAYFKGLELPYVEPRGCTTEAPCSVTGDFNDDGVTDVAVLYQYAGDKARRAGWNLDLIILYSKGDSFEPTHTVFSHVGQVDAETGAASASLAVQSKGSMKVPAGEVTLDRPGINVFYGPNRGPAQYLTFYWRETRFYAIDKSDD